jgi:hypothetical protein
MQPTLISCREKLVWKSFMVTKKVINHPDYRSIVEITEASHSRSDFEYVLE